MEEHLPKRPTWDCDKCGQTWPCANAKTNLLLEYLGNHSALTVYLALRRWEAVDDYAATGAIPPDTDKRFVGWVGEAP